MVAGWPRRCLVTVLVVALGLAGAGCGDRPYWQGRPDAARVAVVGDSYVRQLEYARFTDHEDTPSLSFALIGEGWQAHVHGENGWRTGQVLQLVEESVAEAVDGIAIVAGVNDVAWAYQQPDEVAARAAVTADVGALLAAAAPVRCVVWPTLARNPDRPRADRAVRAVNEALRGAAADGDLVVPEWGARFRQHPEWRGPDGLHLSAEGEQALGAILIGALHRCLDPEPP